MRPEHVREAKLQLKGSVLDGFGRWLRSWVGLGLDLILGLGRGEAGVPGCAQSPGWGLAVGLGLGSGLVAPVWMGGFVSVCSLALGYGQGSGLHPVAGGCMHRFCLSRLLIPESVWGAPMGRGNGRSHSACIGLPPQLVVWWCDGLGLRGWSDPTFL